jgi:hypothetical protein
MVKARNDILALDKKIRYWYLAMKPCLYGLEKGMIVLRKSPAWTLGYHQLKEFVSDAFLTMTSWEPALDWEHPSQWRDAATTRLQAIPAALRGLVGKWKPVGEIDK